MPDKDIIFRWLQRTVRFNRLMTMVILWLMFVYGVPLFPAPLLVNMYLRIQNSDASISVDDIRLRYNILTATPEIILEDLQIGHENISSMVIGLNSHWSLNNYNPHLSNLQDKKGRESSLKAAGGGGNATLPASPPDMGSPNYWEDPGVFSVAPTNAIFSYMRITYAAIGIPFQISDLQISRDATSPLGLRLDGFWQLDRYRGRMSFSKENGQPLSLALKSNKFNLLSVLKKLVDERTSNYLGDYFNFASLMRDAANFEEFVVDGKLVFNDQVQFQSADVTISSANHYLQASISPGASRTDMRLRWNLENLQTLLVPSLAKTTKFEKIDTKGNLALYSTTARRGGLSAIGVGPTDKANGITNQFEVLAYFQNADLQNLGLKVAMSPNDLETRATDYAFKGAVDASKDAQKMKMNFSVAKVGREYDAGAQFNESLQSVCSMFNFCNELPANLVWGADFSKLRGAYDVNIRSMPQTPYDQIRGIQKIYFSLATTFDRAPAFDVPFMNFNVKAGSKSTIAANGYSYGNLFLVEKAHVANENGLSADASDLQFRNGEFYKGNIQSNIAGSEKSVFTVTTLPDGTHKMTVVGDRVSFAPYLGFEKDRTVSTEPDIDILDRHIDRTKVPDVYLVGNVKKLGLNGDHEWSNAVFQLIIRDSRIELADFKSKEMTLFYKVGQRGDAVFRVKGSNAGELLYGTGVLSGIEGGNISFSATARNADEPLAGSGEINDFVVDKLGAMAKLFDLLSITGLFSGNEGVGFDKITASAQMFQQQLIFQNGVMRGPSMEMTFSGRLDLLGDGTDMEGTYVPKNFITQLLDIIPVLNVILPMSGDNAVIGTRYVMTGPVDNLKVRFNVGTFLTPGILRSIFGKPIGSQEFIDRGIYKNKPIPKPLPTTDDKKAAPSPDKRNH
ncbi:MAG: AsmA-like C-terminal region-containing protein [Hydrotalea sp.]|nr:AsmA-like C-terminal region-containing protein [Hydrotalea sp.]